MKLLTTAQVIVRQKNAKQVVKEARVVKDSLNYLTPADILLTSISAAVAETNRLPHAPFASPGGFWLGEGPNSPREALHIILWLRLRWLSFITEGKGHRASYCNKTSGGSLLAASSLCVCLAGLCGFWGFFFVDGDGGGWVVFIFLFLFSLFPKMLSIYKSKYFLKQDPKFQAQYGRWDCPQASLGALQHKGWSPFCRASTCEWCGSPALCNSSLTLGPAHLTSNTWKQISQPSLPGLASHLVPHHLFLSGCDATFTATLASWCLHSLIFFPLVVLSPYGHFFSKPPAWEIWGIIIT